MSIVSGGGGMTSTFIKLTSPIQTQNSEVTVTVSPEIKWEEQKQFVLFTPDQLKNEIGQYKDFHLRPMSDKEYSQLLNQLKTGKDVYGKILYKYQMAAIARVIKENFLKWYPSLTLDSSIDNYLSSHYEIDDILKNMYFDSLTKFRDPFIVSKAEEVATLYSTDEIARLRNQGIAFTGDKFKSPGQIQTIYSSGARVAPSLVKSSFAHPLLKYNLVKGK